MSLRILRATPLDRPKGETLPDRLLVVPWGRSETLGEPVIVDETTAAVLPGNQTRARFDRPALDFNHNTVEGTEAYQAEKGEPRRVAAYGVPEIVAGEGIYLRDLTWTPEGRTAVLGGHFPDLSPAVKTDKAGRVIFLHSAAVCRHGQIDGLSVFSTPALDALLTPPASQPAQMDPKKLLLALLGLADNTDDPAITAAYEAAVKAKGEATKTATPPAAEAAADLKAMSATVQGLTSQVTALTARLDTAERGRITAEAVAAGKVIPASAKELPLDSYRALCAELPAGQVPLDQRTRPLSATGGEGKDEPTGLARTIAAFSAEAKR